MMKLIPRFKTGYKTPDWDPTNPYHYHNSQGEKVVITPEDWEKYKDDPTFREVRAAIEAEQAAHPGPEYDETNNPKYDNWIKRFDRAHKYNKNLKLPEGYTYDNYGHIIDKDGTFYALGYKDEPNVYGQYSFPPESYGSSPKFDYNHSGNFTVDVTKQPFYIEGPNIQNVTNGNRRYYFYPIVSPNQTIKTLKQPLPVDRTLDVGSEREKAIHTYINSSPVSNNKPTTVKYYAFHAPNDKLSGLLGGELPDILGKIDEFKREGYIVSSEPHAIITVPYDLNRMKKEDPDLFKKLHLTLSSSVWFNAFGPTSASYDSRYDKYKVLNRPSHQEAEKKAVIKIGPLEKVKTFANGGYLFQKGGKIYLLLKNLEI